MSTRDDDTIRAEVRSAYAKLANGGCDCGTGCCGGDEADSRALGYSGDDLASAPAGTNLGLGCGNPQAIAALRTGETVLDLGSGAGFDCFLAAKGVGPAGHVIGVDMTPDTVTRARDNARKVGVPNVEFRLGEIERLPVADASVDVILSNRVINLSPDKVAVFREAFRVLKRGGRLAIADVVALHRLPEELAERAAALTGWVAGAALIDELRGHLVEAGFEDVRIAPRSGSDNIVGQWMTGAESHVASATVVGRKAAGGGSCCGPSCCS